MNKKIFNILLVIATIAWTGCEEDFDYGIRPESLRDFNLVNPEDNSILLLNAAEPDEELVIEWEASRSGLGSSVSYLLLADEPEGDFSTPLLTLTADNDGAATKFTPTQKEMDDALAAAGISEGQARELIWSVKADNGSYSKLSEEPLNVTVKRFAEGIGRFNLESPANEGVLYLIENDPDQEVMITWEAPEVVGGNATYTWLADRPGAGFFEPILSLPSDNSGADNKITFTYQQLDEALEGLNFAYGAPARLEWTVVAQNGEFEMLAEDVFELTLFRFGATVPVTFQLGQHATVPDGYDVYLAGEFGNLGVTGGNWDQPGTVDDLKLELDEGTYKKTFTIPLGMENSAIVYKYFLVPSGESSWSHGEQSFSESGCQGLYNGGEGTDNRRFTFTAGDRSAQIVEATVVTWEGFCFAEAQPRARFVVTVPENTPADQDVFITGALGVVNWAQPGTGAGMRMRKVDGEDYTYEIWLPVPENQEVQYKYFLATTNSPRWNGGEQSADCQGIDNRSFTFDGTNSANDVVAAWEGLCQ